ncbi:MAG: divergent polysaccharide deacetylase family protein [Candidatus Omnitrophota bacterium]
MKIKSYKIIIALLISVIILQWLFIFEKHRKAAVTPVAIKGKIAIVLDDWGYNLHNIPVASQIKQHFTAAVLPCLAYSRRVALALKEQGVEIALHLPLEPHEKYGLEKDTIFTTSSKEEILRILNEGLVSVKYAKGVTNHMGSRATEDERVMGIIFGELKQRNLYFLDNMDTRQSICSIVARNTGIHFGRRDVFLDNLKNPEYIKGQLLKLKEKAKRYGWAIGVGHDNKVTLEVLKEAMPQMEKEGCRFVFLSELLK